VFFASIIRVIKSRRMMWTWHGTRMGQKRNAYRLLVGKPEGKRPVRGPRHGWVDSINMDVVEIGRVGVAEDRKKWRTFVVAVMNLGVP
jgi:hypothetical protein